MASYYTGKLSSSNRLLWFSGHRYTKDNSSAFSPNCIPWFSGHHYTRGKCFCSKLSPLIFRVSLFQETFFGPNYLPWFSGHHYTRERFSAANCLLWFSVLLLYSGKPPCSKLLPLSFRASRTLFYSKLLPLIFLASLYWGKKSLLRIALFEFPGILYSEKNPSLLHIAPLSPGIVILGKTCRLQMAFSDFPCIVIHGKTSLLQIACSHFPSTVILVKLTGSKLPTLIFQVPLYSSKSSAPNGLLWYFEYRSTREPSLVQIASSHFPCTIILRNTSPFLIATSDFQGIEKTSCYKLPPLIFRASYTQEIFLIFYLLWLFWASFYSGRLLCRKWPPLNVWASV